MAIMRHHHHSVIALHAKAALVVLVLITASYTSAHVEAMDSKTHSVLPYMPLPRERECTIDRPKRLRLGNSYSFSKFPPLPRALPVSSSKSLWFGPPNECTWLFEAEGGNCTLEFYSRAFERGDVNCDEQYFLVGDEFTQKRYCGFRGPEHFTSRGKQLFLTHFQRNTAGLYGIARTITAYVGGEIRCVERKRQSCPPPSPVDCGMLNRILVSSGRTGVASLEGTATNPAPLTFQCPLPQGGQCSMQAAFCSATTPVGGLCNATGNLESSQIPPTAKCVSSDVSPCANPGNCTVLVTEFNRESSALPLSANATCTATSEQMCLEAATVQHLIG